MEISSSLKFIAMMDFWQLHPFRTGGYFLNPPNSFPNMIIFEPQIAISSSFFVLSRRGEPPPFTIPKKNVVKFFYLPRMIQFANFEFTLAIRGPKIAREE